MSLLVCSDCSTRYAPGTEVCPHCGGRERVEEGSSLGSRLPFLDVTCPLLGCRAEGNVRRVYLRAAAPGVVEMPHRLLCTCCGAAMKALASWIDKETDVPKVTVHGGPTNAAAEREQEADARPPATGGVVEHLPVVGEGDHVLPEREHPGTSVPMEGIEVPGDGTESPEITGDGTGEALPPAEQEGGEEPSPGSNSSTSPEKPQTSGGQSKTGRPKRARTTASPSKPDPGASSTAGSTDTSGEGDG
jgi:hypothetical protein